jgi:hypothetical protein
MQSVAHLLEEEHFESPPANAGDLIFFRQSTPHKGVKNTLAQDARVIFFCILSRFPEPRQDQFQVFPWLFSGVAFGFESFEFAASLVTSKKHEPIWRMVNLDEPRPEELTKAGSMKAWKRAEEKRLRTLLARHDLLSEYDTR